MAGEPSGSGVGVSDGERGCRLNEDALLAARLRHDGGTGRLWVLTENRLAGYGISTLHEMFRQGSLARHTADLGRPVRFSSAEWEDLLHGPDDRTDLVHDAVLHGLVLFRVAILREKWDPARATSLTTYFVNGCLLTLPNIVRSWRTRRRAAPRTATLDVDHVMLAVEADPRRAQPDAADMTVQAEEFDAELDRMVPELRRAARLRLETDQNWAEVASSLEVTPRSLEALMYRHRKKYRRGSEECR